MKNRTTHPRSREPRMRADPAARREKHIERYLLTECRANGFLCMKFVSPARNGVPDRVVITPALTVFVEVKRPGETLRRLQRVTVAKMRRFGAIVHAVDDEADVDELIRMLNDTQNTRQSDAAGGRTA